jgi:glycosyltransferase involved in cell wall biosynthesis
MAALMRGRPIYVIPNAVEAPPNNSSFSARSETSSDPTQPHWIVAMGRLVRQKGFDLLIEAFSRIADRHPQWSVKILGEGPARASLKKLIVEKGLDGRVLLAGWEPDPVFVLKQSDLFVLSSRFEGFPNALLEAMACGLPSISFDCPSGPAEIIRDTIDGLLVPAEDVGTLASTIDRVLGDESLRQRLSAEAVCVVDRFSAERYFANWDAVLRREEPRALVESSR